MSKKKSTKKVAKKVDIVFDFLLRLHHEVKTSNKKGDSMNEMDEDFEEMADIEDADDLIVFGDYDKMFQYLLDSNFNLEGGERWKRNT